MKRFVLILALTASAANIALSQDQPSQDQSDAPDMFLHAYTTEQKARRLVDQHPAEQARALFKTEDGILADIQKLHPDWQPEIVDYRRKMVAVELAKLDAQDAQAATSEKEISPWGPDTVFNYHVTAISLDDPESNPHSIPDWQLICLAVYLAPTILIWLFYKVPSRKPPARYATFFPRLSAIFVDCLVLWPLAAATAFIALSPLSGSSAAGVIVELTASLAGLFYSVELHARHGQTLGKMLCRVKVVDAATERPITYRQALVREGLLWLAGSVTLGSRLWLLASGQMTLHALLSGARLPGHDLGLWVLTLWLAADMTIFLISKRRRALHDIIAGTISVNIDSAPPEEIARQPAPATHG